MKSSDFYNFFKKNCQWIFSGIGVTIIGIVYAYIERHKAEISLGRLLFILFCGLVVLYFFINVISLLNRRQILQFLKAKVKETFLLFGGGRTGTKLINIKYIDKFNCYELNYECFRIVQLINNFLCRNQGVLLSYTFDVAELHKCLKNELLQSKQSMDVDKLKSLYNNLLNISSEYLSTIYRWNHDDFLLRYFNGRSQYPPRIYIQGIERNNIVVPIFRTRDEYTSEYELDKHKGLLEVWRRGKYYICNNIPNAAQKDEFFHPRLDNPRVRSHVETIDKNAHLNNEQWQDCWVSLKSQNGKTIKPSRESCFKSILIIPMTLLNNRDLSEKLKKHFNIPTSQDKDEVGRAIYGFLCFDHQEDNYFIEDEEFDIKFGYIFADILSLYLINRLIYTHYSKTFNKVRKEISI